MKLLHSADLIPESVSGVYRVMQRVGPYYLHEFEELGKIADLFRFDLICFAIILVTMRQILVKTSS